MSAKLRKERMKDRIERLSECEHEQIFRIICKFTDQYTNSESGILVSSENLTEECLSEIEKYIDFCLEQKRRLDEDEAQRNALYKSVHGNQ